MILPIMILPGYVLPLIGQNHVGGIIRFETLVLFVNGLPVPHLVVAGRTVTNSDSQ